MNASIECPIITEPVNDYARAYVAGLGTSTTTLFTVPPSKKWVDITVYMSIKTIENGAQTSWDVQGVTGSIIVQLLLNSNSSPTNSGVLEFINLAPWKHSLEVPIEKEIFGGQQLQVLIDFATNEYDKNTRFVFRYTGRLIDDRQGTGKVMEAVAPYGEQVQCGCPHLKEYMFKKHEYAGK